MGGERGGRKRARTGALDLARSRRKKNTIFDEEDESSSDSSNNNSEVCIFIFLICIFFSSSTDDKACDNYSCFSLNVELFITLSIWQAMRTKVNGL